VAAVVGEAVAAVVAVVAGNDGKAAH